MVPLRTDTAMGTSVSLALLIRRDPSRDPFDGCDVRMNMGVFVTTASIIASAPVVCYRLSAKLKREDVKFTCSPLFTPPVATSKAT